MTPSRKTPARAATPNPILVDSSAWVEFDRATESPADLRLTELIDTGGPVAVTDPVVMEVCAGARSQSHESDLRKLLGGLMLLRFDAAVDFDGAARIYQLCRSRGITPRGLIDCMIASVAVRTGASLLAFDRDLVSIAGVMNLNLDPACHD